MFGRRKNKEDNGWLSLSDRVFPEVVEPMFFRMLVDDTVDITMSLMQGNRVHTFTAPRWATNRGDYMFNIVHSEAMRFNAGEVGEEITQ